MKKLLLIIITSQFNCLGQDKVLITKYPKTISIKSDSFQLYYSTWKNNITTNKVEEDTLDMGNDAIKNAQYFLIYDQDTLKLKYENFPFEQKFFIPIEMNGRKFVQSLRINQVPAYFSQDYIVKNDGKVNFEIPEVYELANIIWTLSEHGQKADNLNKNSKYYENVYSYFKPFLKHRVFKELDSNIHNYADSYYDFRENSLVFVFNQNKIIRSEPYFYVMGHDWENYTSLFQKLIPQIEDFAKISQFKKFYKQNDSYYQKSINKQSELMPVKKMWSWLENNFDNKFNSYKVVYSPLIGATHSTQQYATFLENGKGSFKETVMFVNGPEIFEDSQTKDSKLQEGLASGFVFTEIDHNYINRLSYKYQKQIKSIFDKREIWTGKDGDTERYSDAMAVFNEYMTHAVFCLYIKDNYDEKEAKYIIEKRESLMVDRRKYIKFKEFTQKLMALREDKKVKDLYYGILEWANAVK